MTCSFDPDLGAPDRFAPTRSCGSASTTAWRRPAATPTPSGPGTPRPANKSSSPNSCSASASSAARRRRAGRHRGPDRFVIQLAEPVDPASVQPATCGQRQPGQRRRAQRRPQDGDTSPSPSTRSTSQGLQPWPSPPARSPGTATRPRLLAFSATFRYDAAALAGRRDRPASPGGVFTLPGALHLRRQVQRGGRPGLGRAGRPGPFRPPGGDGHRGHRPARRHDGPLHDRRRHRRRGR